MVLGYFIGKINEQITHQTDNTMLLGEVFSPIKDSACLVDYSNKVSDSSYDCDMYIFIGKTLLEHKKEQDKYVAVPLKLLHKVVRDLPESVDQLTDTVNEMIEQGYLINEKVFGGVSVISPSLEFAVMLYEGDI